MLLTAGGLSFLYTSTPPTRAAAPATTTGMATSASSPDFEAWDAAVKSHVSSSEIRGIRLNSVDYQGIDLVDVAVAVAVVGMLWWYCSSVRAHLYTLQRLQQLVVSFIHTKRDCYVWGLPYTQAASAGSFAAVFGTASDERSSSTAAAVCTGITC